MRKQWLGLATAFTILMVLPLAAFGAEPARATTDELPAALRALNGTAGNALTKTDARAIRGEGGNAYGHNKGRHSNGIRRYSSIENYLGVQSVSGDVYISGKNIRIGSHNHHFRIK